MHGELNVAVLIIFLSFERPFKCPCQVAPYRGPFGVDRSGVRSKSVKRNIQATRYSSNFYIFDAS